MPTPSDEIEQVAALLRGDALRTLLVRSGVAVDDVRATYVRLKPGAGALVAVDLVHRTVDGVTTTPGYLRLHDHQRAAELARKWHADRTVPTPLGDGVRLLDDGCSVLFVFPNDAEVRGLRFVAEPDKLKRLLAELPAIGGAGFRVRGRASTFERVRYKPERRLILRARLALRNDATGADAVRHVFVRFFTDARGERLHRLMVALRAGGLDAAVPEPLGFAADGKLFVEAEVVGRELFAVAGGGGGDASAVAEVVAKVHACSIDDLPLLLPDDVLANALEATRALARAAPTLREQLDELEARLRAQVPDPAAIAVTLHGDCHLHQFLVEPGRVVLVDFERAARGDPAFDLGHLCAHACSSARRAASQGEPARHQEFAAQVVAAYRAARPATALTALPFYTACGLLDRALLPYRHLEPDWLAQTTALLQAALAQLAPSEPAQPGARAPSLFAAAAARSRDFVFYPSTANAWAGYMQDHGGQREYGVYDTATHAFVARVPEADPALPGLRVYAARGEIVAYRVGRRATVRTPPPHAAFVKLLVPSKAEGVARLWQLAMRAAAQTPGFPDVPQLTAYDPTLGALTLAPLAGRSLHDLLRSEPVLASGTLDRLAAALAVFHRSALADQVAAAPPPRSLAQWQDLVAPHDAALAATLARVRAATEPVRTADATVGLVHGDLHDRNIFMHNERIGLLDLDGLRLGDPLDDVGNLAAHFVLRALQRGDARRAGDAQATAWLAAYARCVPSFSLPAACAATARTLIRLACVYRFRSRWAPLPPQLLEAALVWGEAAGRPQVAR